MRVIRALTALMLLTAPLVTRAQALPSRATVTDDRANVRAEPSIDASIVTSIAKGQVVDLLEVRDSWSKVNASGKTGWVRSTALSAASKAATPVAAPAPVASSREAATSRPAPSVPTPSQSTRGFEVGNTVLGPAIGLGGIAGASLAFGGSFEHAIKELPDLGGGVLGFSVDATYYSYTPFSQYSTLTWRFIPVGAAVNYHFKLDDKQWDPFVGIGLGFSIASVSGPGLSNVSSTLSPTSALYFIGRAGVRYFYADRAALQLDAGAGAATLRLGLIFKL